MDKGNPCIGAVSIYIGVFIGFFSIFNSRDELPTLLYMLILFYTFKYQAKKNFGSRWNVGPICMDAGGFIYMVWKLIACVILNMICVGFFLPNKSVEPNRRIMMVAS